jgi:hypothetical protein
VMCWRSGTTIAIVDQDRRVMQLGDSVGQRLNDLEWPADGPGIAYICTRSIHEPC